MSEERQEAGETGALRRAFKTCGGGYTAPQAHAVPSLLIESAASPTPTASLEDVTGDILINFAPIYVGSGDDHSRKCELVHAKLIHRDALDLWG
jgi:hypothetical protein